MVPRMTEQKLTATEARDHFGHCILSAMYGDRRTIIMRHGKPIAAIVPIGDLESARGVREPPEPAVLRAVRPVAAASQGSAFIERKLREAEERARRGSA